MQMPIHLRIVGRLGAPAPDPPENGNRGEDDNDDSAEEATTK
jgi:hypothetical protein